MPEMREPDEQGLTQRNLFYPSVNTANNPPSSADTFPAESFTNEHDLITDQQIGEESPGFSTPPEALVSRAQNLGFSPGLFQTVTNWGSSFRTPQQRKAPVGTPLSPLTPQEHESFNSYPFTLASSSSMASASGARGGPASKATPGTATPATTYPELPPKPSPLPSHYPRIRRRSSRPMVPPSST